MNKWLVVIFSSVLVMGFSPTAGAEEDQGVYIYLGTGVSMWDCTSNNDCEVEAGTELYEVLGGAFGYYFDGMEWGSATFNMRVEAEGTTRRHQIHGLNGPTCERDTIAKYNANNPPKKTLGKGHGKGKAKGHHKGKAKGHHKGKAKGHHKGKAKGKAKGHSKSYEEAPPVVISRTGEGTAKCQTEENLRVYTAMVNLWPSVNVWKDVVSIYAGGGVGVVVAEGLGQVDYAPAAQAGGGVAMRATDHITLDLGYKAIFALSNMELSDYTVNDYTSHGPSIGIRYSF